MYSQNIDNEYKISILKNQTISTGASSQTFDLDDAVDTIPLRKNLLDQRDELVIGIKSSGNDIPANSVITIQYFSNNLGLIGQDSTVMPAVTAGTYYNQSYFNENTKQADYFELSVELQQNLEYTVSIDCIVKKKIDESANSISSVFTNSDLVAGVLSINHSLGIKVVDVVVANNLDVEITPDAISFIDSSNLTVDLTSFGAITGTWTITVIGSASIITVEASGSDKQVQFNDEGNTAGATGLIWDKTTNRVGINTTTPGNKLDVVGGIAQGVSVTPGATIGTGKLGYFKTTDGKYYPAKADDIATCGTKILYFPAGGTTDVAVVAYERYDVTGSFTAGEQYLSAATAGDYTATVPGAGNKIVALGNATTTVFQFRSPNPTSILGV